MFIEKYKRKLNTLQQYNKMKKKKIVHSTQLKIAKNKNKSKVEVTGFLWY